MGWILIEWDNRPENCCVVPDENSSGDAKIFASEDEAIAWAKEMLEYEWRAVEIV